MESQFYVKLGKLIEEFDLEVLHGADGYVNRQLRTEDINRPGLVLAGYTEYFDTKRIQVIGKAEFNYLARKLRREER